MECFFLPAACATNVRLQKAGRICAVDGRVKFESNYPRRSDPPSAWDTLTYVRWDPSSGTRLWEALED